MNKDLLLYEIKRNHETVSSICSKIGISKSAFYKKCSEKTQFTIGEVKKIISVLKIQNPMEIFFTEDVS